MKFDFSFSEEIESKNIIATIDDLQWSELHGYPVYLPKGVDVHSSRDDVQRIITTTFEPQNYLLARDALLDQLPAILKKFENSVAIWTGVRILPRYTVSLVRYGSGGWYSVPHHITIKIEAADGSLRTTHSMLCSLFHELVHLLIEEKVKDYRITHWCKETMVDRLLAIALPECASHKGAGSDTCLHMVDSAVDRYFPDIDICLQTLGDGDSAFLRR